MLVSPAEPREFLTLGPYSSEPERLGGDFLCFPRGQVVAIQRKTCADLVASLRDDRIARELGQLQSADTAILIVEGDWRWDRHGRCRLKGYDAGFLRSQYDGVMLSLQYHGVWVMTSPDIDGTISLLRQIEGFLSRDQHSSLFTRPKNRGGGPRNWARFFYQSWDGIGTTTAESLYDTVGLPLQWTVTEKQLAAVRGVGKIRANNLWKVFSNGSSLRSTELPEAPAISGETV